MKEMKRVLAMVLCLVMLVGILPVNAFAAPGDKKPGEDPAVVETTEATVAETTEATEPAKPEPKGPAADKKDEAPKGPAADKENKPGKENKPEKPGKPGKEEQVETSEPTVPETTEATVPETTEETAPETTEETVPEDAGIMTLALDDEDYAQYIVPAKYADYVAVDAAVIFTDLHTERTSDKNDTNAYKKAEVEAVMKAVKGTGLPISSVTSGGDAFSVNEDYKGTPTGYTSNITGYIQGVLGNVPVNYVWSDHDRTAVRGDDVTLLDKTSRVVFENANYYVYALSMGDLCSYDRYDAGFNTNDRASAGFTATVDQAIANFNAEFLNNKDLDTTKPLLIVSHMPLFDKRNDNAFAEKWCDAINKVAEKMDVFFFYGHNHNHDTGNDYYYAKGSTMAVATTNGWNDYQTGSGWQYTSGDPQPANKTLNFTHMGAGYLEPSSTSDNPQASTTRQGTLVLAVLLRNAEGDEVVNLVTYDANGEYIGNYAVNECVESECEKGTADGGDDDSDDVPAGSEPTVPSEPETPAAPSETAKVEDPNTGIKVTAPGVTGMTVTENQAPEYDTEVYNSYVSYDIELENYTQGDVAAVSVPAPATFDAELPVDVLYDGDIIATTMIVDGMIHFTTNHFSTYDFAQGRAATVGDWVTVKEPDNGTTTWYYTQATEIKGNSSYAIVGADHAVALMNTNDAIAAQNVTINGNTMTSTTELDLWTFSKDVSTTTAVTSTIKNGNRYLAYSSSAFRLNASGELSVSDRGNVFRIYSGTRYFYYNGSSWTRSSSNSAQNVRLYTFTNSVSGSPTPGLYARAITVDQYVVTLGTAQADVLAAIKANTQIQTHTGDETAYQTATDTDNLTVSISGYNASKVGEYTATISYQGKPVETVKVKVVDKFVTNIAVNLTTTTVPMNAPGYTKLGTFTVTYSNNTTETVELLLAMLDRAGGWSTKNTGVYSDLFVSYEGGTSAPVTLTVAGRTGNNHPAYPRDGSVKVSKTGTGIDFQDSGVAQIEISASGVPMNTGIDVIIMLDTSSSMTRCIHCSAKHSGSPNNCTAGNTYKSRLSELNEALDDMIKEFAKKHEDGSAQDIRVAIRDFNGAVSGATARDSADRTQDAAGLTGAASLTEFTGSGLGADAFLDVSENFDALLGINVTKTASGTNYDYAFDAIYQLAYNVKEANRIAGEDRELYVIFMSDGAPNYYNYYGSQGGDSATSGSDDWNYWLTGAVGKKVGSFDGTNVELSDIVQNSAHYYYYHEETGNQHRMANAIKGTGMFEVIRKSTAGLTGLLGNTASSDNLYMLPGLDTTMYSIAFTPANDGRIQKESMLHVLGNIASSPDHYFEAEESGSLAEVFKQIAGDIKLAATKARFVDQLGANYSIQMSTHMYGSKGSTVKDKTIVPYIEILGYDIYTKVDDEADNIPDGFQIGDRKGTSSPIEKVVFSADGTKAYSNKIDVDGDGIIGFTESVVNGETTYSIDTGDNILENGIINAKTFWYNTTANSVAIPGVEFPAQKNSDGTTGYTTSNLLPAETFYWKLGDIKTQELAMRYFVYLDGSMEGNKEAGSYATNEFATLYYDNYLGNPCYKDTVSPVLAWEAATVSYAFYLVNSAGQPVNMNGQVVPFSQRVTIVNPTKYAEVLLNSEAAFQDMQVISAEGFKLPAGYTLYDDTVEYHILINSNGTGMWMIDWLYNAFLQVEDPESVFGGVSYQETTAENPPKAQTTYVTGHNINNASAYTNETFTVSSDSGYDYTHTTVWFAVVLEPKPIPDTVVIDYGLPVDVHVLVNDMFGDYGTLKGIAAGEVGQSTDEDAEDYMESSGKVTKGTVTKSTAQGTFGTAKMIVPVAGANEANSLIRYQVGAKFLYDENGNITGEEISNNLKMTEEEVFTYAVQYANPEAAYAHNNGIYYSTVTVIPATTIYYEDSFVTLKTYERSYVQVQAGDAFDSGTTYYTYDDSKKAYTKAKITEFAEGVTYYTLSDYKMTPGWEPVKEEGYTAGDITQAEDRPGEYNYGFHTTIDANNIYGYDGAYDNFSKYSLGQAAKVSVNDNKYGVATFSFYGTGFDVVSLTSNTSGVLIVDVYKGGQDKVYEEDGSIKSDAELVKSLIVDTYYGYDYGLYNVDYMLENGEWNRYIGMKAEDKEGEEPVDTSKAEEGVTKRTGVEYCWVPLPNKENALYQIPVMEVAGLEYGQYTADINAVYGKLFDHQKDGSYDLYLDAIRIYDPAGTTADELGEVIENAYKQDGEAYPVYQELRNNVIAASDFQYTDENDNVVPRINGITFLDGDLKTLSVADYVSYGPNNELYLAPGQAVTFGLDLDNYVDDTGKSIVDRVHLGIKSADGTDVSYALIDATGVQAKMDVASDDAYKAFVKKLTENNQEQIEAAENDAVAKLPEGATAEEIETAKQAAQASVLEPLIEEAYEDIVAAQLQAEKDAFDAAMKDSQKTVNSTTTDMYYDMTALKDKAIIIYNNGVSGILSLTNIKITFTEKPEGVSDLFYVDYETISKVLEGMKNVVSSGAESGNTEKSDEENQITLTYPEIVETGYEFTVQVTTTEETARVTVNGVEAQSDDKKHWSVKLTASEEGEMTVTAIAFNENSEETATVSAEVTVQVIEAKPVITVAAPAFVLVGSNYEITGTSVNTASITVGDTSVTPDDKGNWSVPLKASDTVCVEELVFTAVNNSGAKTTVTANVDTYAIDHPESANSEENIVVTITTTSNAAKVTADAKVITTYRTGSNGNRVWTTEFSKAAEAGEEGVVGEIAICVYNEEGYSSDAYTVSVNIIAPEEDNTQAVVETIRNIVSQIVNALFSWFGRS